MRFIGYAIALVAIIGAVDLAKAQGEGDSNTLSLMTILEPRVTPWYLPEGHALKLVCSTRVRPDVNNIAWEKAGRIIDQNANNGYFVATKVDRGEFISTLEKEVATKEDGDSYLCHPTGRPNQGYNVVVNMFTFEPVDATIGKYKDNATLQCNVEGVDSYKPMEWWFDGKQILPTDEEDKYTIDANNNTLTIQGVLPEHVGEYVCKVDLYNGQSFNATVTLKAAPHVYSFEKSKNLVQGDPLVLVCEVAGYPEPALAWYTTKDDEPLEALKASDPRVSLTPNKQGVENGTLRLEDLTYDDRAEYTCVATNEIGTHNSTILVRVKDKLAALWPFLGICAEVAILVIIIFVYENRRSKKLEELDAREEADHLTNSHSHKGGDEVRQRK